TGELPGARVSETRFRLAAIALARPLPRIALDDEESGLGLTIRHQGRPIAFVLRALSAGAVLEPEAVARPLGPPEPPGLGEERIRRELLARASDRTGVAAADTTVAAQGRPIPSLTAVVCTHDRPARLARCLASLASLRAAVTASRASLEILVVDNAPSDDQTRDA